MAGLSVVEDEGRLGGDGDFAALHRAQPDTGNIVKDEPDKGDYHFPF